jgi:NADH-quinone oxidoreductase subunit F
MRDDMIHDPCCDACWHSAEKPCPDLINCLVQGPVCHEGAACRASRDARARQLRRETLTRAAIFVGAGTCGLGAGAGKTLDAVERFLAARGVDADIVEVGCIGLCSAEPLLDVQLPGRTRVSFQSVTEDKVSGLLEAVFNGRIPSEPLLGQHRNDALQPYPGVPFLDEHPFFAPQTRWVLAKCGVIDPCSIDEYIAHGGYAALAATLRNHTPAEVCDAVEKSGLRGRGGGGFPTGTKWKFTLNTESEQKYLVCNADEGDPGAFMDRAVIEGSPHQLLEGMAIAAYAIGATKAYVYLRAEYPLAIKRLRQAIADAEEYGLLGSNILDSGFTLKVTIKQGAGAFVCGEETALLHSIEGDARHAPAAAALPGGPGPVRQADGHQQRRDPGQRAADRRPRRGPILRGRHRDQQGHEGLRALRQGRPDGPRRGGHGHAPAPGRLRHRRGHPRRQGL